MIAQLRSRAFAVSSVRNDKLLFVALLAQGVLKVIETLGFILTM